jgi:hypothetical protein
MVNYRGIKAQTVSLTTTPQKVARVGGAIGWRLHNKNAEDVLIRCQNVKDEDPTEAMMVTNGLITYRVDQDKTQDDIGHAPEVEVWLAIASGTGSVRFEDLFGPER